MTVKQTQLATKIDTEVKNALAYFCKENGLTISHFIEEAIIARLEDMQDMANLNEVREEPARPFSDVLKDLKKGGKI